MRRRRPPCGCPKEIVYPTKHNVVNKCSEETINHIHPSHTTVVNHHLVKNQHIFPHSTSFENTVNSVDTFGGAFNTPPTNVAGAMTGPGMGQVAGAMSGPGMGQVAGAMQGMAQGNMQGMGQGNMQGMGHGGMKHCGCPGPCHHKKNMWR